MQLGRRFPCPESISITILAQLVRRATFKGQSLEGRLWVQQQPDHHRCGRRRAGCRPGAQPAVDSEETIPHPIQKTPSRRQSNHYAARQDLQVPLNQARRRRGTLRLLRLDQATSQNLHCLLPHGCISDQMNMEIDDAPVFGCEAAVERTGLRRGLVAV